MRCAAPALALLIAACAEEAAAPLEKERLSGFVETGVTEDCLPVAAIERRAVVDQKTVRFELTDGRIFQNELPYACPGLTIEAAFAYDPALQQLCSRHSIQVLTKEGVGAECGLGPFVLLRPNEAVTFDGPPR